MGSVSCFPFGSPGGPDRGDFCHNRRFSRFFLNFKAFCADLRLCIGTMLSQQHCSLENLSAKSIDENQDSVIKKESYSRKNPGQLASRPPLRLRDSMARSFHIHIEKKMLFEILRRAVSEYRTALASSPLSRFDAEGLGQRPDLIAFWSSSPFIFLPRALLNRLALRAGSACSPPRWATPRLPRGPFRCRVRRRAGTTLP